MNLAIGDELVPGYDPKALNSRHESRELTRAMHQKTICDGRKGASLTIKDKSNVLHQLQQFSLPAYDRILMFYGDNDYLYSSAKLDRVHKQLIKAIRWIRQHNPWVKIYGVLPLPMYDIKDRKSPLPLAQKRNAAGYTLHDLIQMLSVTYADQHVDTLNWTLLDDPVINRNNYRDRLIKGRYPTDQTYRLMAKRIDDFVKSCDKRNRKQPTFPIDRNAKYHPLKPNWAKNRNTALVDFESGHPKKDS